MEAASTVVIKVKYGDTMRRFNAWIVDEELHLNMDELKRKILSLFGLALGTELMLTYTDEDGDVVTLVDADDLRDVVKQGLDPLRITVKLISEKNAGQLNHSNESSTPVISPQVPQPLQNLHDGVSRILKNVPEPLLEILRKNSVDFLSKASSDDSCIPEVVDRLLKIGSLFLGQHSESPTTAQPSTSSDISEDSPAQTKAKDTDISEINAAIPKVQSNYREEQSFNSNVERLTKLQCEATTEKNKLGLIDVTGGSMETSSSEALGVKAASSLDCRNSNVGKKNEVKKIEKKLGESSRMCFDPPSVGSFIPIEKKVNEPNVGRKTGNISAPDDMKGDYLDGRMGYVFSSSRDIRCSYCGLSPLAGTWFKSKIKLGYHLCTFCFSVIGNDIDYIRIDSPVVHKKHMSSYQYYDPCHIPTLPQASSRFSKKKSCGTKLRLNSCFIQDVTVSDGTIMAPLTPFTKIWRMRNNGMAVWPQKTLLVWTGGDRLTNKFSFEVEIPAAGFPVNQDLDIAVDLIAPEIPGQYISSWIMVSPSGQKFGQGVWVVIQVDTSIKESTPEIVKGLNLNLPCENSSFTWPEIISANIEPIMEDNKPESKKTVESVEPVVDLQSNYFQETFPINDSLLGSSGGLSSIPLANPSVQYRAVPMFHPPPSPAPFTSSQEVALELPDKKASSGASTSVPFAGFSTPRPVIHMPNFSAPPAPISSSHDSAVKLPENEVLAEKHLGELEETSFGVGLNEETWRIFEYFEPGVYNLCRGLEWDEGVLEI